MDLLAADPSPKFCRTIWKVAAEAGGSEQDKKKRYERLRKKYNRLKDRGQLPQASTSLERKAAAIADAYARRRSAIEEARANLSAAEAQAESLGLNLNQDLDNLAVALRGRRDSLDSFLSDPADWLMGRFLQEGITDPDAAKRRLYEADEERQLVERQLEILHSVRRLRDMARMRL